MFFAAGVFVQWELTSLQLLLSHVQYAGSTEYAKIMKIIQGVFNVMIYLFSCMLFFAGSENTLNREAGIITINNSAYYVNKQRPSVAFPHERHIIAGMDCLLCHHKYKNGKNIISSNMLKPENKSISCSFCHGSLGFARLPLQEAYHGLCLGCHGQNVSTKKGPILCGHCHIKKREIK